MKPPAERPTPRTPPPADERMSRAVRWTVWTLRRNPDAPNKKPSKVPTSNPTDPSTWTYYHAARAALNDPAAAGIGFEMHGRPGVVGVDLDDCFDEAGGRKPTAASLLSILEAAGGKFHVEVSPSGKGLRIFAAETPLPFHDFTNKEDGVEVYSGESGRFLTYTGAVVPGFGEGPFHPLPPEAVDLLGKSALRWKDARPPGARARPEEPVPDLTRRPEDWQKLHPNAIKRLSKEHREFLATGAIGARYASASEHLFAAEQALLRHLKPPQVFQVVVSAEGSWGVALEHREGSAQKAREFVWADVRRAAEARERGEKDRASSVAGWKDCEIEVEVTEDGPRAKLIQLNMINSFRLHPDWLNRLGYNVFDGRVTVDKKDMTVTHLAEAGAWLCRFLKWSVEPYRTQLEESVAEAARSRPWNPVEDELRGLVWDGRDRVGKLAEAVARDPVEPLDREIMRKWLVGFVARGLNPGCQMDTVLSLREAVGGGYKTTFARVMAGGPERFAEAQGFGTDKDSSMLRCGKRIIELGEGVAVRRADKHALKVDLSKTDDYFRAPWGRVTERRPRGFVYVLTSNEEAFLSSSQDGLRRMWPVMCRDAIDIEWVRENRDQLLAQGVALHARNERWWWDRGKEPPALLARQGAAVSEDFLDDAVEGIVADADNRKRGYVTLTEAKRQAEALAGVQLNSAQAQHLIGIMTKHGMSSGQRRVGGMKLRLWGHPTWSETRAEVVDIRTASADSSRPSRGRPVDSDEGGTP